MKKDLLVTLADKNYINQAKQLFSSVYWNAGWKGDYMLLSYEIPEEELKWFQGKGILIKKCEPLYHNNIAHLPPVVLSKFYLFTPEFKKWKNIVYLDGDIIVRASLDDLTKIKGFAAVQCYLNPRLHQHFRPLTEMNKKLFNGLKKHYFLKKEAFNTGVMAFNTDIINEDSFSELKELFNLYREIIFLGEQPILNLFFYKKWVKLSLIYNIYPNFLIDRCIIRPEEVNGIILHFPAFKPWVLKDYFYNEWRNNLEKAEQINLNKIQNAVKVWNKEEIKKYCSYIRKRHMLFLFDRYVGCIGIFLKNNFPKLYFILKKLKNGKPDCLDNNQNV